MRNLDERLEDIKYFLNASFNDTKRSLDIIHEIFKRKEFSKSLYGEAKSIEDKINLFEFRLEDEVVKTIARFQPMADTLRFLVGSIKFSSSIERMNDLSINILKVMKHSKGIEYYNKFDLIEMLEKVQNMHTIFFEAYSKNKIEDAYLILSLDEEVNAHKTDIIEKIKAGYLEEQKIEGVDLFLVSLEALFISQHLERIGDSIKNLAESLIYILKGVDIRHGFSDDI